MAVVCFHGETMSFHKHGVFSFTVSVQRMRLIEGDSFVADVTAFRLHGPTGAAQHLQAPDLPEQHGDTARQAEGRAIRAMQEWLMSHSDRATPLARDASISG
jgi:hypothetical protein